MVIPFMPASTFNYMNVNKISLNAATQNATTPKPSTVRATTLDSSCNKCGYKDCNNTECNKCQKGILGALNFLPFKAALHVTTLLIQHSGMHHLLQALSHVL